MIKAQLFTAQSIGAGRTTNEDVFRSNDTLKLYMISDGSSSPFGKWAAECACAQVEEVFQTYLPQITSYNKTLDRSIRLQLIEVMDAALQTASQFVYNEIDQDSNKKGSFATLSAALILQDCLIIGHVGNCRIYHIRDNKVFLLTKDHTRYQEMLDGGFTDNNINPVFKKDITQIIGLQNYIYSRAYSIALISGDRLLFCTDGVHHGLSWNTKELPKELKDAFNQPSLEAIPKLLVDAAEKKGVSDNITSALLRVSTVDPLSQETVGKTNALGVQIQIEALRQLSLFSSFKDDEATLLKIHSLATVQTFQKGRVLLEQGTKADRIFVILKGRANILVNGEVIRDCGVGTLLGEMGFFTEEPRTATVVASEDTQLLVILKPDLDRMVKRDKDFGLKLYLCAIQELSKKLAETSLRNRPSS